MSYPEKYEEAMKKVIADAKINKNNYLVIQLSWDQRVILPYEAGTALVAALKDAELFTTDYDKAPRITGFKKSEIMVTLMSQKLYQLAKVSELLNLDKAAYEAMVATAMD